MKKFYIFLFIIPLIFTSCETDDDNQNNGNNNINDTSGSILGTWELTSYEVIQSILYIDPINGMEITQSTDDIMWNQEYNLFLTLRPDNTWETIRVVENESSDTLIGTYLKTDNILSVNSSGFEYGFCDYTITTLNDNNLFFNGLCDYNLYTQNDTTFIERWNEDIEMSRVTERMVHNETSIKKLNSSKNSFGLFGRNKSSNK